MFGWTKFQSTLHSQRRPLAFSLSFLCPIRSIFYTGRRARTHMCTQHMHTHYENRSMFEAPWCMFHVHSFINKFSHYRSFGDDFSSLCVYSFRLRRLFVAFFFHQKSSNRSVRLMVNHLRREPKTIWASHTPYGILSSRYGFWFDAIAATVAAAVFCRCSETEQKKRRKLDMRRCEIVDCIVRSMIAKYFFGSSISWHGQR